MAAPLRRLPSPKPLGAAIGQLSVGPETTMRTLVSVFLTSAMMLTCSWAQQSTVQSNMSPGLRQFMNSHPTALDQLNRSFSDSFSNKTVWVCYFYSDEDSRAQAFHFYPNTADLAEVVICVSENQGPIDQFITMLFEALNSKGERRFSELMDQARAGTISKTDFARAILKQEFEATKETRDLLVTLKFRPKDKAASHYFSLFAQCPSEFDDFLAHTKRVSGKRDAMKEYVAKYDLLRRNQ